MIIPLVFTFAVLLVTLLYASVLDLRDRRVPFKTWYPAIAAGIPAVALLYGTLFLSGQYQILVTALLLSGIFSLVFYSFAYFNLFGGADAWALIFITAFVPLFPAMPLLGYPPLAFFPFSVLVNAVIINLFVPAGIFVYNIARGNRAPLHYLFFGFPVPGASIRAAHGFVMEEISEENGVLVRRFIPARELLMRALRGERTLYTRDLRVNPGKYQRELELFGRAGSVWILYGIPFIVPITGGFILAFGAGDLIFAALTAV